MLILLVFRMKIFVWVCKKMYFDGGALGNKSTRDKSLLRLLKSPAIMVSTSSVSSCTRLLPSNPNELCDRSKFSLYENEAGINSHINMKKL